MTTPAMKNSILLTVTTWACPLEVFGTVGGRPIWYRQRGIRWELYEATQTTLDGPEVGVDEHDHITGPGITWIVTGQTNSNEEDGDLWTAIGRIMAYGATGGIAEATREGLTVDGWIATPEHEGAAFDPPALCGKPVEQASVEQSDNTCTLDPGHGGGCMWINPEADNPGQIRAMLRMGMVEEPEPELPRFMQISARWQKDQPRVINRFKVTKVVPPTQPNCYGCAQPFLFDQEIVIFALGPGDPEDASKHDAGRWYSAIAGAYHAACTGIVE